MRTAAAVALLAVTSCAHLDRPSAARSLADAESAFAAHSVREDMRAAFIAHFAPGGVLVRDGWVEARAWLEPRPAPPIVLDWRPQYVEVASSGELGLSTGPWRLTSLNDPSAAPAFGQFVSIWRREGAGPWRVEVDLGIPHAQPTLWKDALVTREGSGIAGAASLEDAERSFAGLSRESVPAAYARHGAGDLRIYRNGVAPVAGREAAIAAAALPAGPVTWRPERIETARSADFGYARGAYTVQGGEAGEYLRAWRREALGWRIVLDVVNPRARR